MSQDAESKRQQEMMSMLPGGLAAFNQLSHIPGAVEQVLAAAADPVFFNQPPGSPYPVGTTPIGVAVGDFTGNGLLDIVTANQSDNNVSVLLNNGDGTFAPHQNFSVGSGPQGVAVGDFNGDGKLDIVTANNGSSVSVLLNTTAPGSPTVSFAAHQDFSVGFNPQGVAVGDFNRDGKLDIVAANNGSSVSVLLNTTVPGSATTSFARQDFPVGKYPRGVAVGDFNRDGKLDIVAANEFSNSVSVLLQNPLVVNVETIQAIQNVPFSGLIAIITGTTMASDTHVTINWGEGSPLDTTTGTVSQNLDGSLTVSGSHFYTQTGTFPLTVTATEGIFTSQGVGQAIVQVPLAVQVNTVQASANVLFNGPVATISGANSAGDTTALINWGDGTPATQGTVSGSGTLTVSGSHMYSQGCTFTVTVTAIERTHNTQGIGQAIVQPPLAVEVATIQAVATMPFSGAVAIISGATSASDTTATINWGDSTPTTLGTVVPNPDGTLTVSGSHTYSQGGTFTPTVTATESTRTATGAGRAIVKTANLRARAFGVQSFNPPQDPFGDVSIPSTGGNQTETVLLALLPGLVVSAITDTVSGSLTPTPPRADASSGIGSLIGFSITPEMIEDPDQQALVASGISAMAHADLSMPSGVLSGATTFASLIIGSTIFPAHFAPGANTVVSLPGLGTVTLNEQTVTQNANQILIVVNALHIHITQGPRADTDIVVGHVEAGITLS